MKFPKSQFVAGGPGVFVRRRNTEEGTWPRYTSEIVRFSGFAPPDRRRRRRHSHRRVGISPDALWNTGSLILLRSGHVKLAELRIIALSTTVSKTTHSQTPVGHTE